MIFIRGVLCAFCVLFLSFGLTTNAFQNANDVDYVYDDLGRLERVTYTLTGGETVTYIYAYDPAGNRTSYRINSSTGTGLGLSPLMTPDPVTEGQSLSFQVTTSRAVTSDVAIPIIVTPADSNTVEGQDYASPPATVTLVNGTSSATFTIATLDDGVTDGGGALQVSLGTFVDDEGNSVTPAAAPAWAFFYDPGVPTSGQPVVAVASAQGNETDGSLTHEIYLDRPSSSTVSVAVMVSDGYGAEPGVATEGADYIWPTANPAGGVDDDGTGTIIATFTPGTTRAFAKVNLIDEPTTPDPNGAEGDEFYTISLASPVNATLGSTPSASGKISDPGDVLPEETPPDFAIANASAIEGGVLGFVITKTGPVSETYEVAFAANGISAAADDYTVITASPLVFAPGDSTKTIQVQTTADADYEPDEQLQITLGTLTRNNINLGSVGQSATGTILNDDPEPILFTLSAAATILEGNGAVPITVSASRNVDQAYTVRLGYVILDAETEGADFDDLPTDSHDREVVLTNGSTAIWDNILLRPDSIDEPIETFQVVIQSVSPTGVGITYDPNPITVGIEDDDPEPQIAVQNATPTIEGDTMVFAVNRVGSSEQTFQVDWTVVGGTATPGTDFTGTGGTISVPGTIELPTLSDSVLDASPDETIVVRLSNPVGGASLSSANSEATGIIEDLDATPVHFELVPVPASITEETGGSGIPVAFEIRASRPVSKAHTVRITQPNHITTDYADFAEWANDSSDRWINFSPGDQIRIWDPNQIEPDAVFENNETFSLKIYDVTNPAGGTAPTYDGADKIITILDDDAAPSFAVSNASVSEGGTLSFTVTKSGSTALSHSVSYATATGSAGSSDFTAKSGTLTFSPGQTSQSVSIATTEDAIFEGSETMVLNLSGATGGATIADASGTGTITNDDGPPSISLLGSAGDEPNTPAFVDLELSKPSSIAHTVSWSVSDESALVYLDLPHQSSTVTFNPGVTSVRVYIEIFDDNIQEGPEYFRFNVSNPTGGATLSDTSILVGIGDDGDSGGGGITF